MPSTNIAAENISIALLFLYCSLVKQLFILTCCIMFFEAFELLNIQYTTFRFISYNLIPVHILCGDWDIPLSSY